jgi:hypothetical protein
MTGFTKFNSQVPDAVLELFSQIEHGQKQFACSAGLIWYFNADEHTQRLYREWARAIAEGYATVSEPPESVAAALAQRQADAKPRKDRR